MGSIKEGFKRFISGLSKIFGDDPNQYVEAVGEGLTTSGAIAVKNGSMSKEQVAELIRASRESDRQANSTDKRIEGGITLTPSDKSGFRDDSTMEQVNKSNVSVRPAGELENHVRQAGGRERDSKTH